MSASLLRSQSPESRWLRTTASFCLVWGAVILALALFEIWSGTSAADALELSHAFVLSGCGLLAAAGIMWIGCYRIAPIIVLFLILAVSPLADPTNTILNAALLSHDRSETVGAHALALIAVVLTPVLILLASGVLSFHWLRWLRAETESESYRIAGVPAQAADQPWQPLVEHEEAEWHPPVWRIASGLFAAFALVWILAAMALRLGITDYSVVYSDAWSTAGLLSPLAGWVAVGVLGLMHARTSKVGRWFGVLLMCLVVVITMVAVGVEIIERW